MATGSTTFHVVVSGNNNSVLVPYYPTQQFDLDDAITMPENPLIPDIAQRFDLDEAITMPGNPKTRLEEVAGMVCDMPEVDQAAGSCSVCMESFGKSEKIARRVSCGHVYHHNCITNWLLNGNGDSCPLCRREISGRSMI
ncbi:hypothetical protein E1A91_D08G293800v1 [Gossypium mustelinum]|uniref:RING-type domain-containing protein n=1 Tax=Gossypium mustelinum TaxID=34275 RepID=A0A5D2U495_GOSMU|nr:hypothetical protein E1A91_D08G293800v1 [Gossypium mustelinum]